MVKDTLDLIDVVRKHLKQARPDLLRELVASVVELLMSADADACCNAAYGELTTERTNRRNGYRERSWDTRVGTIDLAIPRLRSGSYFPEWLLERRRRAEQALIAVVAECHLLGVSTRRVENLVNTLGIERISKSQFRRWPAHSMRWWRGSATVLWTKVPTATCGWTLWRCAAGRRGSKTSRGGSRGWRRSSPPQSTPRDTGRSSVWTWLPTRMQPAGSPSCAT